MDTVNKCNVCNIILVLFLFLFFFYQAPFLDFYFHVTRKVIIIPNRPYIEIKMKKKIEHSNIQTNNTKQHVVC